MTRFERYSLPIMLVSGFVFGLLWPYVPVVTR